MLRIHFEAEDLTRTTVAPSGDVLWEILLSLHALQERAVEVPFDGWRRRTRPLIPSSLRPLFEMAPARGYSADFLTPTRGQDDLEEAMETVLATPGERLTNDLTELARHRRPAFPSPGDGAGATMFVRQTCRDIRRFFDIAIAPYWRQISLDVEADRTRHIRTLGDHGVERLLETLHPGASWRHPVLHIDDYVDQDLRLGGRGLVLVPSFFGRHHPMTLKEPGRPPLLVFPVSRRTWLLRDDDDAEGNRPLTGLLGRTRTVVLETSVAGGSTTDMARAAEISLASVSHHTKVLREAGLITTRRDGCAVRHQITELGMTLLGSSMSEAP